MSLYFEEINIGDVYRSPGRTITETDVVMFAAMSGDYSQLHTNEEYAKNTIYGQRIAHGALGFCIATGLYSRFGIFDGTSMGFIGMEWRFVKPIFIGDTIHIVMTITGKRETSKKDRGIIERTIKMYNQNGVLVQEGVSNLLIKRKT